MAAYHAIIMVPKTTTNIIAMIKVISLLYILLALSACVKPSVDWSSLAYVDDPANTQGATLSLADKWMY